MEQITDPGQYDGVLKGHKSVVIIFSANWSQVAEATRVGTGYSGLNPAWINIDQSSGLTQQQGMTAIPTTLGYKDGVQVNKFIGPNMTEVEAKIFIENVL